MSSHMKIIVAVNASNCIDFETTSDDRQRFAALTIDGACVCGRKTWDTLPTIARKNRSWHVLTRDVNVRRYEGGPFYHHGHIGELLEQIDGQHLWVCGGGEIYQQAVQEATHLYISRFVGQSGGSIEFPPIDASRWEMICSQTHPNHLFQILRRRNP